MSLEPVSSREILASLPLPLYASLFLSRLLPLAAATTANRFVNSTPYPGAPRALFSPPRAISSFISPVGRHDRADIFVDILARPK